MAALSSGQYVNVGKRKLLVQEELGSGAFGTVFKVYDINMGTTCALKDIPCKVPANMEQVLREAQALIRAASHQRIVQILDVDNLCLSWSDVHFLILTEFCAGGDLNSRLAEPSTCIRDMKWVCQISEALSYLHSLNPPIVHRDLKADNVLLTNRTSEDLKLGDFGLAREYVALKNVDNSPEAVQTYYMRSGVGPTHWMAPEFFTHHYTEKADIFSLGGIFYAILERDFRWFGPKKMYGVFVNSTQGKVGLGYAMAYINNRAVVQLSDDFKGSNSMKQVIQNMLEFNPHNRPSAKVVYGWVENIRSSLPTGPSSFMSQAWGGRGY